MEERPEGAGFGFMAPGNFLDHYSTADFARSDYRYRLAKSGLPQAS